MSKNPDLFTSIKRTSGKDSFIVYSTEATLRDYFAACAMQALLTKGVDGKSAATDAYHVADRMLEARDKK